jgi:hypothetical protein
MILSTYFLWYNFYINHPVTREIIIMPIRRSFLPRFLFLSASFFFPTLVNAASCPSIIEKISKDVIKYSSSFKDHKLPWAQRAWLQHNLGSGKTKKVSDVEVDYTWACPNSDIFLTIQSDKNGSVTYATGKYASEKGEVLFSTETEPTNTSAVQQGGDNHQQTIVLSINPEMCRQVWDEIKQAYSVVETTHAHIPPYEWENLSWLEKNLGESVIKNSSNGAMHIWYCDQNSSLIKELDYMEQADGGKAVTAMACTSDVQNCGSYGIARQGGNVSLTNHGMVRSNLPNLPSFLQ